MGDFAGAICCILVVVLPIALLIGALVLSGGVWFTNACLPESDEYDGAKSLYRLRHRPAVPVPSLGQGMGVTLVSFVAVVFVSIPLLTVLGAADLDRTARPVQLIAYSVQMPLVFLAHAGVRSIILPAPFGRACLVVLFEWLILFMATLVFVVPLVLLFPGR